jgi:hypothetical protein
MAEVKQVIKSFAIEMSASTKNELSETEVYGRLRKAGGANYE